MRWKFILLALRYPNLSLLLLRRTLPELTENHVLPLMRDLNKVAKYNSDEKAFTFPNGSRLKLGYCEHESDVLRYQGHAYEVIGLEEATMFSETQMVNLLTCNRVNNCPQFTPRAYYTANPGGIGHQWFKRLFIDRDYFPSENPSDYVFIPAKVYDNKYLMDNDPGYVQYLKTLPDDLRKAFLDGDWEAHAGQFFRVFDKNIHVIPPFEIPAWWKRVRSLDYGLDMTACIWWAISDSGQCFAYRELHEPNLNLTQAAKKIVDMTPASEHISYTTASPDLWNRRQETGASGMEIMSRAGLKGLVKAKHDRIQGWRVMREHLEPYDVFDSEGQVVLNEFGEPKKSAQIQIFENCKNMIKYIPMLQHDEHNVEYAADKPHIVSHINESCRYFCMSRHPEFSKQERLLFPPGTSATDVERIRTNMEFEKVYRNMRNRGIHGGW